MKRTPDHHTNIEIIAPGSFERGYGYHTWRPMGSGDFLLIFTRSGLGYADSKSKNRIQLEPNTVALWETNSWQSYGTDKTVGKWNILWTHFNPRPHWRTWMRWPERYPGFRMLQLPTPHSDQLTTALETTLSLARADLPFAQELAMNAFERALLEIHRADSQLPGSRMDPRIRNVVEWLATLPRTGIDSTALAQRSGLSPSRFAHLFRDETGSTPQQMLENNRMKVATQLLRQTQLNIQEIAHEIGYEDALYFSRRFRHCQGTSPSSYRRAQET